MMDIFYLLESSHVQAPYGTNQTPCGLPTSCQESPQGWKGAKRLIIKRDGSLDALKLDRDNPINNRHSNNYLNYFGKKKSIVHDLVRTI